MEVWKDIEGYEGLYQVSNEGRVRSLWFGKVRILKNISERNNYKYVNLCKDGVIKRHKVHRLVAYAFIPNTENLPEVNHKDENPQNNNVENLEWCNRKYNNNYGTHNKKISEKLTNGKKSKPILQFTLDGEFVCEWRSMNEAQRNGFNATVICLCCKEKRPQHKGFIWKYKEVV